MKARGWWVCLLALALLMRGMAGAHAQVPMPVTAPAAAVPADARDCHPHDAGAVSVHTRAATPDDAHHATPQCQIACDLLAGAGLLAAPAQAASQPVAVRVPVVPRMHVLDAPPPDRPPPIG